ncbi:MAG: DUF3857 domain-containing protein [Polyangiaceae bacterium]
MKSLVTLAVLLLLFALAPHGGAVDALFHPDLTRAQATLDSARGADAYSALRRVWATWDRADPAHVEAVLRAAAANPRLDPPARAYAQLLSAYARLRRGDLGKAREQVRSLGFVTRWMLVGPFDNEGKAGLAAEAGPESELGTPIVLGRAYSGKERPVRWRAVPDAFPFGFVDLGALLRPERKVCGILRTTVAPAAGSPARRVSLWLGSGGAFRVYFNGAKVLEDESYRHHDADRLAVTVNLLPGANDLTVKICGDDAPPVLSLRLADEKGNPDPKLDVSIGAKQLEEAARRVADSKAKLALPPQRVAGPLQALKARANDKRAASADAFARYLVDTDGDDNAEHLARDLAKRAAEQEPTIERLLLAGALAEDRNQEKDWIDRAEALVRRAGKFDEDVTFARAQLLLGGPSWRKAVPLLDQVLARNPNHPGALEARTSLYNSAGLKRTALAELRRAAERNPWSVGILNMLATQERSLGHETEAAEAEARYFALRFDDRSYLGSQVDLAVARRDRATAERWVSRLLDADPDSQWALGLAARTYRAFGQPERAIATYQRALELAPEDVGTLRTLSDLMGELGRRNEQLKLLRAILKIRPQDKDVREYVAHIEPEKPRADEVYAWNSKRFLRFRHAPAAGHTRRTLRNLTVSTVFSNGLSSQFHQVVFQPLTDAAAAALRQYSFQYQADRQVVQLRGAKVFRGDGRVDEAVEYGESAADDPSISMYTSSRNFTVQLPRLEPGDVVELRYRVDDVTPRNEFADYFGEVIYLQSDEPVKNAEYVLISPKQRTLHIDVKMPGLVREVKETKDLRTYRFFAETVAPLVPEPAMPPWSEVLGFIHVSTYAKWSDLGRWYWGLAKEQFDLDDRTRKLAREIAKGKTTELEKVQAVYDWVIRNTRYVALEFGIYGFKPRRCVQTVSRGWGDCKDKATVIVTLLKELGIPSTIVVLRTQLRGDFRSSVTSLAPFDHAIAYVPSLKLYLDGTAEYTGIRELPRMDLGALALWVNQGDSKLVRLPDADPKSNVLQRELTAVLAPDGSGKLELTHTTTGVEAPDWRRRYHADATREERMTADLARQYPGFAVSKGSVKTSNLDDYNAAVVLSVKGSAPSFARREGDRLSAVVTPEVRLTPSYASLSQRSQDVRILGFSSVDDTTTVRLPPGYKVLSAPESKEVKSAFGSASVEVKSSQGQVTVQSKLSMSVSRVSPKQYPAFRRFCADVDRAFGSRLVVGK